MHQSIPSTNIPPRVAPGVLHSTAALGLGFILDDLPWGPGFCISIKLCISQFQAPTSPPPRLTQREFFKVVKFPVPGQKIFAKSWPQGKKIDKISTPGNNFVDLQENFAHRKFFGHRISKLS